VQPARSLGHLVDESAKLRRDELGRYRAAGLRRLFAVAAERFAAGRFTVGLFF
jgi:hypothetical protein